MSRLSHRMWTGGTVAETPLSLELRAQHAGYAWACQYSSSAEYDAALIAERRAAGVYGPRRRRRQIAMTALGIAAGIALVIAVIQIL